MRIGDAVLSLARTLAFAGIAAACAPGPGTTPPTAWPSASPALTSTVLPPATPVADSPAAGICGGSDEPLVTVIIYPDIPDPRCSLVRPEQRLRVVNRRPEAIRVMLAGLTTSLEPGEERTFEVALGQLLAPGVHRVEVEPCCGAELWLQAEP